MSIELTVEGFDQSKQLWLEKLIARCAVKGILTQDGALNLLREAYK